MYLLVALLCKKVLQNTKKTWEKNKISMLNDDYLSLEKDSIPKFNLLITNPPYTRHQHLTGEYIKRLREMVKREVGLEVSGYAGLYIYFVLLSHKFLEEGAFATWLIPSEFMSVGYGKALRRYLTEQVELKSIHVFSNDTSKFKNATVSSAVITYKKVRPSKNHSVELSMGDNFKVGSKQLVPIDTFNNGEKWINIIKNRSTIHEKNIPNIGDFFQIRRGIATGNNNLFIVSEEMIDELELKREFYKYIIPSSRYLDSKVINADKTGKPVIKNLKYLIDTDLSLKVIKREAPKLYEYFMKAESEGETDRYILRNRKPWYKQEQRLAAPFLCSYMGRTNQENKNAFNIFKNYSDAIVTNNYLMMYPKGLLEDIFSEDSTAIDEVFKILNNLNQEYYYNYGREYGGGLKKVEPKEFSNIPVPELAQYIELKKNMLSKQQSLFDF